MTHGLVQEAILHTAEEWSTHRKLIPTSADKPFRTSLHPNLPYFHAWFDPNRGLGHVIESQGEVDTTPWPEWFGREVLAGPLDIPPERWRRPKPLSARELVRARDELRRAYMAYDWTSQLTS